MAQSPTLLPDGAFADQTAFVTGGGTGLGLEVATRLGRLGARVVVASRSVEHHEEIRRRGDTQGFAVHTIAMDVRDPRAVKEAFRETARVFGPVDVLVNNAAGNFIRPAIALAPKGFATVIDIALNGVFTCSREAALQMREKGGAIVNVSAPYAFSGKPGVVHSACAKAGVESMTRTLAAEWAQLGIRVNAVSPGPFHTQGAAERLWPTEGMEEALRRQIPLGRFGDATEVGEWVCLLASRHAPWVTGSVVVVDGGWTLPASLVPESMFGDAERRPRA
jgi:NAD(P)-dependent dehydrogenase (short-subunit alcohol dehydrogenase family)